MRILLVFLCLGLALTTQAQVATIQQKAWTGDSAAMMLLADRFALGDGIEMNEDSARLYVEKAAKKGHPDGQYLLGSRLTANLYDAKKFSEGMSWLKKAAEKGQEEALVKLSTICRTRNADTEAARFYDLKAAYHYAEKAAMKGNVASLKYCAEARLTGTGTTKNDSIALAFMRVAAEKYNDAVACVRMGDFYLDGKFGGKSEPFEALGWYQRALSLPYLNMDQRNSAEYGVFKVDKMIRQTHNSMMMSSGMLPSGAFQYQIRKD